MADDERKRPADAVDLTKDASPEKKQKVALADIAKELVCPITQELPIRPVTAEDGKIYEEKAIREWFSKKDGAPTSPSTGAVIGTRLLPAPQARNTIEELVKSGDIDDELATAWKEKLEQEKVVKEWRAKAEGGDGDAMYLLGTWYGHGQYGLAKDAAQSRTWYERSAATRDPRGMTGFGVCLLLGYGGPKNTSLGWVYITDAAHLGSDLGAYLLGDAFIHGRYGLSEGRVLNPSTAKLQAQFWLKKVVDGECEFKHLSDDNLATARRWLDMQEELRRRRAAAAERRRGDRPGG